MTMDKKIDNNICIDSLNEKAERELVICGDINEDTYLYLLDSINKINKEDELIFEANQQLKEEYQIIYEPVSIIINSGGGDVVHGVAIMDLLDRCIAPIHTHVEGMCGSMAVYIYLKGEIRTAGMLSEFGVHGMLCNSFGYLDEVKKTMAFAEKVNDKLDNFLLERTNFTKEELLKTSTCLHYYDYTEAIDKGLVTEDIFNLTNKDM